MHRHTNMPTRKTVSHILLGATFLSTLLIGSQSYAHEQGRYSMIETKNGIMRLDKTTGTMSTCTNIKTKWSCNPIETTSGDRPEAKNNNTIAALKLENLKLKQKLQDLQMEQNYKPHGPSNDKSASDEPTDKPRKKLKLPTDDEVDEAITFMEKMIRKFGGAMKRLREQEETQRQEL